MCNYLLHNLFLENAKNLGRSNEAKRSKTGNNPKGQKNYATPTNEDLGRTSNWPKLVGACLPVAQLTILDRLVILKIVKFKVTIISISIVAIIVITIIRISC